MLIVNVHNLKLQQKECNTAFFNEILIKNKVFQFYFSKNLYIGNRTEATIKKNKPTSNPSIAIMLEISSVVKKVDIK